MGVNSGGKQAFLKFWGPIRVIGAYLSSKGARRGPGGAQEGPGGAHEGVMRDIGAC